MNPAFSITSKIYEIPTVDAFLKEFQITEKDLIFSTIFVYKDFFSELDLPCKTIMVEDYGKGEPDEGMVDALLRDVKEMDINRIIAIGGGTVLDLAKLMAMKGVSCAADIYDDLVPPERETKLVLIPTTCGTGSEVTNTTVIYRPKLDLKVGKNIPCNFADEVVLLPELLSRIPYKVFITSAVDALCHLNGPICGDINTNIVRDLGRAAYIRILRGFDRIRKEGPEVRFELAADFLYASCIGGINMIRPMCNPSVNDHAISMVFGGKHHVPHGECNALFVGACLKKKAQLYPNGRIRVLADVINEALGTNYGLMEAMEALDELIGSVFQRKSLSEYGMKEEDIEEYVTTMIETTGARMLAGQSEPMSHKDFCDIYRACF